MKKLILLISVLLLILTGIIITSFHIPEKKFYYGFDEKIYIKTIDNKLVVRYHSTVEAERGLDEIARVFPGIMVEKKIPYTIITGRSGGNISKLKDHLLKQAGIRYAKPVYALEDTGSELIISNEIVVKFKAHTTDREIDSLNKLHHAVLKKAGKLFQVYSLPDDADALEAANSYQESGLTVFALPNFISKMIRTQTLPNDPYFVNQFYLHNTGQTFNGHSGTPDADIDAPEAWAITEGSSSIKVAVLDDGVTYNHTDLPNTRQLIYNGSNFADGDPDIPAPQGNNKHGTACAGIIAATKNNNIGISGIAPNVKIMPVRIFNSDGTGIAHADIAAAITFAKNMGADVLSNSWALTSNDPNFSPPIVSAIQDAIDTGRGGLGCVVVFAAGNTANHAASNSGYVQFPGNVAIDEVITVGASSRYDMQANYSPTSSLIDVVAPSNLASNSEITGEIPEVWTIDNPGSSGFNPWTGISPPPTYGEELPGSGTNYLDFTGRFYGTSAATPQVAAVAALLLSVDDDLTSAQVADLIIMNVDKVGGYTYTSGHSNEMGYGRLNAHRALKGLLMEMEGPDYFCTNASYFVGYPATSISWSVSGGVFSISGSSTANPVSITSSGNGTGIVTAIISRPGKTDTVTKSITSGFVFPAIHHTLGTNVICATTINNDFYIDEVAGATNYNWTVYPVPAAYSITGNGTRQITFGTNNPGTYALRLAITTACGTGNANELGITVLSRLDPECGFMRSFVIYPNPAGNVLNVRNVDQSAEGMGQENGKASYHLKLYDDRGKIMSAVRSSGTEEETSINTQNIPNGIYYLHITEGKNVLKKQVIIRH